MDPLVPSRGRSREECREHDCADDVLRAEGTEVRGAFEQCVGHIDRNPKLEENEEAAPVRIVVRLVVLQLFAALLARREQDERGKVEKRRRAEEEEEQVVVPLRDPPPAIEDPPGDHHEDERLKTQTARTQ